MNRILEPQVIFLDEPILVVNSEYRFEEFDNKLAEELSKEEIKIFINKYSNNSLEESNKDFWKERIHNNALGIFNTYNNEPTTEI